MNTSKTLETLLIAALPLITAIISAVGVAVRKWAKSQDEAAKAKIGATNYDLVVAIMSRAVRAVEQTVFPGMTSDQKKDAAIQYTVVALDELGVHFSYQTIEKVLEAMVFDLNGR